MQVTSHKKEIFRTIIKDDMLNRVSINIEINFIYAAQTTSTNDISSNIIVFHMTVTF